MSLRTLKFGDRTISYETGLDLVHKTREGSRDDRLSFDINHHHHSGVKGLPPDDDGIGTSDDETGSSSSSSGGSSVKASSVCDGANFSRLSLGLPECFEDAAIAGDGASGEHCRQSRKVVRLDMSSLTKLLAFDEEEEDEEEVDGCANDDEEESGDDDDDGCKNSSNYNSNNSDSSKENKLKNTTSKTNSSGHFTASKGSNDHTSSVDASKAKGVKNDSNLDEAKESGGITLVRRHSMNLCQSRFRKTSASSSTISNNNDAAEISGPKSMLVVGSNPARPQSQLGTTPSFTAMLDGSRHLEQLHVRVPSNIGKNSCEVFQSSSYLDRTCAVSDALKTLDLRLEEVAHIRSVLTKAQLESLAIDQMVKTDIEKGKICFICKHTRFGLFTRGQKCEMCKQMVCIKCHSKMRIPLEHFSATPVFALSPGSTPRQPIRQESNSPGGAGLSSNTDAAQFQSLSNTVRESSHQGLSLSNLQSVGSAPSSPLSSRASSPCRGSPYHSSLFTLSKSCTSNREDLISLSGVTDMTSRCSKYATLPRKPRRFSVMGPQRNEEREKLEGAMFTICSDCKDMVVQVIRVSRTNKRSHLLSGRPTIFSLYPSEDFVDFKAI